MTGPDPAKAHSSKSGSSARKYGSMIESSKPFIDADSNWLITLSDVLSLLLVFFMMFFIATKRQAGAEGTGAEQKNTSNESAKIGPPLNESIKEEMARAFRFIGRENAVSLYTVKEGVVIAIGEKVGFIRGTAGMLPNSKPLLDQIAATIKKYPQFDIEIEGHTDDVPIKTTLYPSNWELSVARAESVLKYLVGVGGIEPSRVSVRGSGEQRPLVANDTPENRARNRRVEIKLRQRES